MLFIGPIGYRQYSSKGKGLSPVKYKGMQEAMLGKGITDQVSVNVTVVSRSSLSMDGGHE